MKKFNKQQGFSLIEVLIGMLILTIGILGMASMQITSKRLGYDALQRSIATNLTHDIVERMRSNRFVLGSYVSTGSYISGLGGAQLTAPVDSCKATECLDAASCAAVRCADAQIALQDIYEWEQALDGASEKVGASSVGGLVNPRACISNDNGLIRVAIAWQGFQALGNPLTGNAFADGCGVGQGLYGNADEQRQLIFFTTYINSN